MPNLFELTSAEEMTASALDVAPLPLPAPVTGDAGVEQVAPRRARGPLDEEEMQRRHLMRLALVASIGSGLFASLYIAAFSLSL